MFLNSDSNNLSFEKNSEYEIYHNMIGIFEQLKKKKIKLNLSDDNTVELENTGSEYEIRLGVVAEAVTPKTKLERILSKIIFNSPDKEFKKYISTIKPDTTKVQHTLLLKNLKIIYDILEIRRVESCYGEIYPGANDRFVDARAEDFKKEFPEIKIPIDPIEALRFARYDQMDLVLKSEFKDAIDYIKGVELTGKKGAYDLALMYWEKVVQEFLFRKKEKNENQALEDYLSDEIRNHKSKEGTEESKTSSEQNDDKSSKTLEDVINEKIEEGVDEKAKDDEPGTKQEENVETEKSKLLSDFKNPFELDNKNNSSFEKTRERLKKSGKKEISTIEKELEKISKKQTVQKTTWKNIQSHITVDTHKHTDLIEFNKITSKKLKNTFKKIQGGRMGDVDSTGEDIDVDAYIDFKINKIGKFLIILKNLQGLTLF